MSEEADLERVTPQMIEAGVQEVWHGAAPPQSVVDLVCRVYRAMERAKRDEPSRH